MTAMNVVRANAGGGSRTCAHQGAHGATGLSANQGSTYSAGADELGLGVMTTVMGPGLCDGGFMGFLRSYRKREHGCG